MELRKKDIAAFSTILLGLSFLLPAAGSCAEPLFETEEYNVASALIDYYLGSDFQLVVIGQRTEPWCINAPMQRLKDKWSGLKNETIDSLIVRNTVAAVIEDKLPLKIDYRLISYAEYLEALGGEGTPDWDRFDSIFPDATGFLNLSRVAFDADQTQALVYFYNAYRCSGTATAPASRSIAFLVRENGAWTVKGIKQGVRTIE